MVIGTILKMDGKKNPAVLAGYQAREVVLIACPSSELASLPRPQKSTDLGGDRVLIEYDRGDVAAMVALRVCGLVA